MASAEIAPFAYFVSNEYQGVFRDIGGVVQLVSPGELARILGPDHFPLSYDGAAYDEVLEEVRGLALAPPT